MEFFATTPEVDLTDPWQVSPGIEGFIMFAVLGLALWLIVMAMTRSIRKANYRAEEREEELYGPETTPRAPTRRPAPPVMVERKPGAPEDQRGEPDA